MSWESGPGSPVEEPSCGKAEKMTGAAFAESTAKHRHWHPRLITLIGSYAMQRHVVLVRHGQSGYNASNLFTGWLDPPLTELGIQEAHDVAKKVHALGLRFDAAFSSVLNRAKRTAEIILANLDGGELPITADAALNERDYRKLAGLNKAEASERWGDAQIHQWRRSYLQAPPAGESLRDTIARALPFYLRHILLAFMRGQNSLVVAHGNSLARW